MKTKPNSHPTLDAFLLLAALMTLGLASAPSAVAASGNWNVNAAGNWNTAGNWNPATVPGTAAGDVVGLITNISAARTITLDTAATVGTLNIGDPTSSYFGYTLSGGSTLTFNNSGSSANLVQATSGGANDTISVPITLTDNLTIYDVNGLTNSGVVSGSAKGITKAGTGTLTLNGSAVNTYTGPTAVTAGTLLVELGNLSTPTDLVNNGSTLTLGGGTLQIKQKSATTTSQTFNGTTVNADSTTAVIGTQVTSGALTVDLGAISPNTSGTVDFTLPTGGSIKTTTAVSNGILGGWATTGNNVSSGTVGDWATTNGSSNIVAYTSYTSGTPSGVNNANNYKTTAGATVSANATVNSLVISGAGADTTVSATLTLNSGGLFIGGTQRWLAGNGTIKSGLASGELYLHCNNSGYTDYQIQPVIADGAVATKVIKDGPGILRFQSNNKTYTGGTVVNGGELTLNAGGGTGIIRGSVTVNPGATLRLASSGVNAFGNTSTSVSVTNVTINGGTLNNTSGGDNGYFTTFNLNGGTMTGGGFWIFGSAANSAINSLASPIVSTIGSGGIFLKDGVVSLPITTALGTVPNGIDLLISVIIDGSSGKGITKSGSGTLRLSAINTYNGGTIVNGGTLDLNNGGSAGCIRGTVTVSNAVLQLSAQDATGYAGDATSLTAINLTNGANLNVSAAVNETLGSATINMTGGSITGNSGGNIDFYQGSSALKTFASSVSSTISGMKLTLRQGSTTFTVADGAAAIDLDIASVIKAPTDVASLTFIKAGAGYMRLTAANTYTNNTRIDDGTFALGSGGSISNSPTITLNSSSAVLDVSAATFTLLTNQTLSGRGTVVGTVNVNSGGIVTAGTNNVGNLTLGGLTFNGTATNNVRPGAAYLIVTNSNGLTASGAANSVKINLGAGALTAGTYTLIDYEGTIQGTGFSAFVLGTTPGGLFSYTLSNNTANASVDLVVTALTYNWTGAQSTEWSTSVIAGSKNWKQAGSPIDYANGQPVVFDDTATGTTIVDVSVADVTPSSVQFNNVSSNYTLQGTKAIAGTIGLTKSGAGTVTINNTNSFVGAVTISGGTVVVGNIANKGTNSALGAGTNINLGGATLSYTGTSASSDRPIVMTTNNTINVPSGATSLSLTAAVSGLFALTKTGAGTLVLENAGNDYGATTMNEGIISVTANAALGSTGPLNFGGGTLAFTGSSAISSAKSVNLNAGGGTVQVDNTAGATLTAVASGTGGLTKTGNGSLTLNNTETYTGGTVVNQGTLTLPTGGATGGIRGSLTVNSGATATLSGVNALGYTSTSLSVTNVSVAGGTVNNTSGGDEGYFTAFNLTGGAMSGGGFWIFGSAANSAINSLASSNMSAIGGNIYLKGDVGNLPITTAQGTVSNGIDLNISAAISGDSGKGIVKSGAGYARLANGNTYTGSTTVNGGTLEATGYSCFGSSSSFSVTSGGVLKLNAANLFTFNHGAAMGNTRVITVDAATLLMDTNFEARFGNVTLKNGSTWTGDRSLTNYDAFLANTDTGAATVLVTNTSGTTASTMNGAGGIHLQGVQNFNVADVTGDSTADLAVSMFLGAQGSQGGAAGGINKLGAGTMTLSAVNTYNGDTTISAGTLALSGAGSIASSPTINVGSGAVLDVSAATITLGGSQLLKGNGSVSGALTVNGTITPGTSIGTLTFSNAPTLNGGIVAEINQTNLVNADLIVLASGTLAYGGTLTITNIGPTVTNGTFTLFSAAGYSGGFTSVNYPLGGAAHWKTNNLVVDGTISFTNFNPVATDIVTGVVHGGSVTVEVLGKHPPADADGDSVSITGVGTASSGTSSFTASNVTYIASGNVGTNTFTYTVADGFGGTDTRTVTVIVSDPQGFNQVSAGVDGGNAVLAYLGIPGTNYSLEITHELPATNWTPVITNPASVNGSLYFTNPISLMPTNDYYRTRYVP